MNVKISRQEFEKRIDRIRAYMDENDIDAVLVYGDEYRKENLRYVSNYWPIFERGAMVLGRNTDPVVLCAPEGQKVAEEMSIWPDIRLSPDFLCVTVPDEIDYPLADYTSFKSLASEIRSKGKMNKLAIAGMDAMSVDLFHKIKTGFGAEIVNCNDLLYDMRREKSEDEISCLREAARIADIAFQTLMQSELIGKTELEAAGIAEAAARKEGAEHIIFQIFGSGDRTHTIVGRPSNKVIEDGDMIMCALAVQYEGYVATCEMPFAVGNYSKETEYVIDVLVRALKAGQPYLKAGIPMKEFVQAVKDVFREENLTEYDVYPPLHGIGCAEAESPYPDVTTEAVFKAGMTVNTDISLFGLPGGSNRIEEGFVITETGAESLSPFINKCCEDWRKMKL
ncbi:MAG: M24 family metallopeptidase [Candidatus Choladocola sp.]|nr:M24 family metallopeptidase [Candidatus Choladocola sp.]